VSLNSQTSPDKIDLLLAQTQLGKGISVQNRELADRQLLVLFTDSDGMNNKFSAFLVQPSIDLLENGKIEGISNRQTAKFSLQLKLINMFSSEVLAVREVTLTGAGNNLEEATKKTLAGIRRNNPSLAKVTNEFRQSIATYYQNNCTNILETANESANRGDFQEAFSLLQAIPAGTPCFKDVSDKKNGYFQQLQEFQCLNILTKAEAASANNDQHTALNLLSSISANSPCFEKSNEAITALESKVDEQLKQRFDWLFKFYSEGKDAETAKWNAMSALYLNWLKEKNLHLVNP
jgi:hypothetical protein